MNSDKEIFEKVYEKPETAVWTEKEPPIELVELIKSGKIKPCKVIDVGCGEGFYSIYLSSEKFDVLGIDISKNAIKYAKENAKKAGVNIKFKAMDFNDLSEIKEKFDFVLEWGILHCIPFEKRKKYVETMNKLLKNNGKYLSTCFNVQDTKFGGPLQKIRIVPESARALMGEEMYFSSLDEIKELFEPYFSIIESKVFEKIGGGKVNIWNYFFMEKRK
ncbi:hypothetical protein A3K73_08305 [Candidatus Pacearchaeota archaeon RBG_13_36_9]|nr:MAG: hypothetical protein A3K73_08305 [Candidatus Pacearchaeota archaeon RBG_13_36_9]